MMKRGFIYFCASFIGCCSVAMAQNATDSVAAQSMVDDSTLEYEVIAQPLEEDSSIVEEVKVVVDTAKVVEPTSYFDATKYILDDRYIAYGDGFTKKWNDHLFLEIGAGFEKLVAMSDFYKFNPMTTAHVGIGKQFNRLHSLRLIAEGAFGYLQQKDMVLYQLGGKLDYLFSISSYLDGHKPDRILDISTILGMGVNYSKMRGYGWDYKSIEFYTGLQFRFYTGPQGYLNFEPYFGINSDQSDLSASRNWRRYDVFYGANLNFIHYFKNNLSREARSRFIKERLDKKFNSIAADSASYQSWQAPFFVEVSTGAAFSDRGNVNMFESIGPKMDLTVGKWFSSAIGLRLSATTSNTRWEERVVAAKNNTSEYTERRNAWSAGLRAEAMFNPFGFKHNYNWDSPAGVNILAGLELAWLNDKNDKNEKELHTYTLGLQFWTRLSDGLRFFIEPRYSRIEYDIPYNEVERPWQKRHNDNMFNVNLGLTVLMKSAKYRRMMAAESAWDDHRWSFGLGAGMPFLSKWRDYEGDGGFDWNASVYAHYRFSDIHGVRAGFSYTSITEDLLSNYTDINLETNKRTYKRGVWNRTFNFGMASLAYSVNMTNLFCDRIPGRRWNMELFVGPAINFAFNTSCELASHEEHLPNHKYVRSNKVNKDIFWGAHGGLHLSYDINDKYSIFASPTVYMFRDIALPAEMDRQYILIETVNLGVQYNF